MQRYVSGCRYTFTWIINPPHTHISTCMHAIYVSGLLSTILHLPCSMDYPEIKSRRRTVELVRWKCIAKNEKKRRQQRRKTLGVGGWRPPPTLFISLLLSLFCCFLYFISSSHVACFSLSLPPSVILLSLIKREQ